MVDMWGVPTTWPGQARVRNKSKRGECAKPNAPAYFAKPVRPLRRRDHHRTIVKADKPVGRLREWPTLGVGDLEERRSYSMTLCGNDEGHQLAPAGTVNSVEYRRLC